MDEKWIIFRILYVTISPSEQSPKHHEKISTTSKGGIKQ